MTTHHREREIGSLSSYPRLHEELLRVEELILENTGLTLFFSDGSAGTILWNLYGLRAGLFSVRSISGRVPELFLRFNSSIIHQVGEDAFRPTVAHEYAHAVVYRIRSNSGHRFPRESSRPHGELWQSFMHLFGHPPKRCHDYPVTPARKGKSFSYRCTRCHREYRLGAIRHERLSKNPGYLVCGRCRGSLRHEPERLLDV